MVTVPASSRALTTAKRNCRVPGLPATAVVVVAWAAVGAGWRWPTLSVATLEKPYVWPAWPGNVAEVCVVAVCQRVNAPPLSETKTSNEAIPEPPGSSAPDQLTGKVGVRVTAGSGSTLLVGVPASRVLKASLAGSVPLLGSWGSTWLVSIGSLASKTIRATLRSGVPVGSQAFGRTV